MPVAGFFRVPRTLAVLDRPLHQPGVFLRPLLGGGYTGLRASAISQCGIAIVHRALRRARRFAAVEETAAIPLALRPGAAIERIDAGKALLFDRQLQRRRIGGRAQDETGRVNQNARAQILADPRVGRRADLDRIGAVIPRIERPVIDHAQGHAAAVIQPARSTAIGFLASVLKSVVVAVDALERVQRINLRLGANRAEQQGQRAGKRKR